MCRPSPHAPAIPGRGHLAGGSQHRQTALSVGRSWKEDDPVRQWPARGGWALGAWGVDEARGICSGAAMCVPPGVLWGTVGVLTDRHRPLVSGARAPLGLGAFRTRDPGADTTPYGHFCPGSEDRAWGLGLEPRSNQWRTGWPHAGKSGGVCMPSATGPPTEGPGVCGPSGRRACLAA